MLASKSFNIALFLSLAVALPTSHMPRMHQEFPRQFNSTPAAPSAPPVPNGFGSTVTSSTGLTFFDPTSTDGSAGYSDPSTYNCFSGPVSNFPPFSAWITFIDMFELNQRSNLGPVGDSWPEQIAVYNAILAVSADSKVDARVILSVILQESAGNVHVGCTNNGVLNCGLMQSHNPADTSFNPSNVQASITQMVIDGTQGTVSGPGLVQLFNDAADTQTLTSGNPYNVVRAYNSGCINPENLSDPVDATGSYASDIANRLLGWDGSGPGNANCGFTNGGSCPT